MNKGVVYVEEINEAVKIYNFLLKEMDNMYHGMREY